MFRRPSAASSRMALEERLPGTFLEFIWRVSGWNQIGVSLLSVAVFLLHATPIELQRRIIDLAVKGGTVRAILILIAVQAAVVIAFGLLKLLMNVYRGWISEGATRALRLALDARLAARPTAVMRSAMDGVGVSVVLAESDDVGAFVGSSVSVPIVEIGFLLTVFSYLATLQIWLALLSFVVLLPQLVFVPMLQRAINRRISKRIVLLRQVGAEILVAEPRRDRAAQTDRIDVVFHLNVAVYRLKFTMNFLMNLCYSVGNTIVLAVGAVLVVHGQAEIATIVTFLSAIAKIVDPWNDMIDWARNFATAKVRYGLIVGAFEQALLVEPATEAATAGRGR
jgi:ABC-type multidrug transport system fused ATPase/permease subunit